MRIILFVYLVGLRRVLKTAQFWTEFTRCNAAAIKGVDVLLPNVYYLDGRMTARMLRTRYTFTIVIRSVIDASLVGLRRMHNGESNSQAVVQHQ